MSLSSMFSQPLLIYDSVIVHPVENLLKRLPSYLEDGYVLQAIIIHKKLSIQRK